MKKIEQIPIVTPSYSRKYPTIEATLRADTAKHPIVLKLVIDDIAGEKVLTQEQVKEEIHKWKESFQNFPYYVCTDNGMWSVNEKQFISVEFYIETPILKK